MTFQDWYWLAGFWEGEGSVSYSECTIQKLNGKKYLRCQLQVNLAQKDRTPLDWVASVFGGGVYKADHCFAWKANGHIGAKFLTELFPYLRLKFRVDKVRHSLDRYALRIKTTLSRRSLQERNKKGRYIGTKLYDTSNSLRP